MDTLKEYDIQFVGLKLGKHSFTYSIEDTFFEKFQYEDFQSIHCKVDLVVVKKATLIEFHFSANGLATLLCDTSNEPFEQTITNTLDLIVKFGDTFNDEDEAILILPHAEYQINIAQYIYETIVLAIPIKRTHPGLKDGSLQSKVLDKLKELEIKEHETTDPRWDKLNELLTSKKL
ncbi:MAG TPA: DUF177 domain-containing protein [Lutibacter sp.]|nr:DUF177 domain-containing protein [Lutibacter sp.]